MNENELFEEDVDVIISTSSIQKGQSIKENILYIFVQTHIDMVSSVKQFLGGKQNSDVYVYVRYGKHLNRRKYSIPNNRYERHLNLLRDGKWNDVLYKFCRVRFCKTDNECISDDESVNESINDVIVNESINDIEFTTKKEQYSYYGIDVKEIHDRYEDKMRYDRVKDKRGRMYKLVKK